jgi:hypothetical protein
MCSFCMIFLMIIVNAFRFEAICEIPSINDYGSLISSVDRT